MAADRPLVFISSPYAGDIEANVAYAREALADSLERGEAPYAPHLLYPQAIDDGHPELRKLGMRAGKSVLARCDLLAVYGDLGESTGMRSEITFAVENGITIERRYIGRAHEPVDEDITEPDGLSTVDLDAL